MTVSEKQLRAFADELRKHWSFDDGQMHTHSWHDRENFIERKLPALLTAALSDQVVVNGWRKDIENAFQDRPVFMLREDGTPTVACLEGVVWRDDQEAQIFPLAWMPVPALSQEASK